MADLHIPDESWSAWCQGADVDRDVAEADIRLISTPVVASELRRLAEIYQDEADRLDVADRRVPGLATAAGRLALWADELDPPQSGGDH